MKCLIVHNYYQKRGGEDSVFEAERDLLSSAGHDVQDFTIHNDLLTGKSKIKIAAATLWNHDIYQRIRQRCRDFKPDIVHFHNTFPMISPAALYAAKDAGAAVVMSLHNYRLLCPSANLYRNGSICEDCLTRTVKWPSVVHGCYRGSRAETGVIAAMLAVHRMAGSFSGLVDKYVALSEHSRSLFIRGGFSPAEVVVKPNFVSAPPPEAVARRVPFVLFVGRLVPEKGIPTLLRAWSRPTAPDVPLVVVGEGPLASDVAAAGGNVHLLGSKTRPEVYKLMRRASLLICPSEWSEPFGLVIVEAFANALPVLAAGIGAARELIDHGRTGYLFDAADPDMLARAAYYALECPEALGRMGVAAELEYRTKYTPACNLSLLEAIYRDAIDRRVARTPAVATGSVQPHPA
ncbi:MAG: kanE 3 [Rhodospirillales bacterium]|nr:kanE 3 [Rhodospirillales bacterium]